MSEALEKIQEAKPRRFRPYPEYKDSGVVWLGEIPAPWKIATAARLINSIEQGWSPNAEERTAASDEWAVIKLGAVDEGSFDESEHKALPVGTEPKKRFEIRAGDFLITRANTPELVGAVCVVRDPRPNLMLCDLVYRLQLQESIVSPEFLAYWFLSSAGRYQIKMDARGSSRSMVKISHGLIRNWYVLTPPLHDQRTIVQFLDRETAKIDALVAKKERLIELLQEQRTALITHAVTRGLDPSAPMKHSGIEWLGEIPAHWESSRIKWVARMESGHTPNKKVEAYWKDGDIPWVSLNDTRTLKKNDFIEETVNYTNAEGLANSSAHLLPERSVVFSRDATIGLCAITNRPMAVSQHFIAWVCGERMLPEYLLRVFDAMQQELGRLTMGATLRTIGMPEVGQLTTPVPPRPEQEAIVQYVLGERSRLDSLISKVQDAIDRLQEFRTALIAAAVTGKIDVREEAA